MQFGERYDILRQIGRGTTASVFLVRDKHLDKRWVAKVFDVGSFAENRTSWLVQNEIEILKLLNHPRMPRAVDLYRETSGIYLIMDYMEGVTLSSFVNQHGPVSEEVALTWMMELCQLLNELHSTDPVIFYCDLKPENVILQKDGRLALVDFGSARVQDWCKSGQTYLSGTQRYTAPELFQHQGSTNVLDVLAPGIDVYSIGAVAFFAVTGMHPMEDSLIMSLTRSFRQLLLGCMEKKEVRTANCDILCEKIQKIKKEKRD